MLYICSLNGSIKRNNYHPPKNNKGIITIRAKRQKNEIKKLELLRIPYLEGNL